LLSEVCSTSLLAAGVSPSPFWEFTWCSSIINAKRSLESKMLFNNYYTALCKQLLLSS
jgi:hypothetical protein